MRFVSFAVTDALRVSFAIRAYPSGEGSRLPPSLHAVITRLLKGTKKTKITINKRCKESTAKSDFYFSGENKLCDCKNICLRTVPYAVSVRGDRFSRPLRQMHICLPHGTRFCSHERTYFNVFRTISIQFCPHGSVH